MGRRDGFGWEAQPEGGGPGQPCPVTALGQAAGRYWFLTPDGELRQLLPRGMTGVELLALFAGDDAWLKEILPQDSKNERYAWSVTKLQGYLLQECHAAGAFAADKVVRGPGVWPVAEADGGGLVVHSGDVLWRCGAAGLERLGPAGVRVGRHIYPAAPAETPPAAVAAGADEARAVLDVLDLWSWRAPSHAAKLLLGWVAAAGVAGALSWRPHVLVTGGQGSGKTTLTNFLRDELLGSTAIGMSDSTEAGIRQALMGSARPVFLDEIENEQAERGKAVIRLARLASSEGQGSVYRGSVGGQATAWPMRAAFLFSAIIFPRLGPQDASRIAVLELDQLPVGMAQGDVTPRQMLAGAMEGIRGAGPRLRRRMLDGWGRFETNLDRLGNAVLRAGSAGRVGDQLGTLLAAAETLLRDAPLEPDEADRLIAEYVCEAELVGYADESDQADALDHLLTTSLVVHWPHEGSSRETVADLLQQVGGAVDRALRNHGVAVLRDGTGPPGVWVAVANQHAGLAQLYAGTRWADAWRTALRRVHGAKASTDKVSFGGWKSRATLLPWGEVFDGVAVPKRHDMPADI